MLVPVLPEARAGAGLACPRSLPMPCPRVPGGQQKPKKSNQPRQNKQSHMSHIRAGSGAVCSTFPFAHPQVVTGQPKCPTPKPKHRKFLLVAEPESKRLFRFPAGSVSVPEETLCFWRVCGFHFDGIPLYWLADAQGHCAQ